MTFQHPSVSITINLFYNAQLTPAVAQSLEKLLIPPAPIQPTMTELSQLEDSSPATDSQQMFFSPETAVSTLSAEAPLARTDAALPPPTPLVCGSSEGLQSTRNRFSLENPATSSFDFLFSFIFEDTATFAARLSKLVPDGAGRAFCKQFLLRRMTSLSLRRLVARLDERDAAAFAAGARALQPRARYQRASNSIRALFTRAIEYMREAGKCSQTIAFRGVRSLRAEAYLRMLTEARIADAFLATLRSTGFRAALLTASRAAFQRNFGRWSAALVADPSADVRMGMYPADLRRALHAFEDRARRMNLS